MKNKRYNDAQIMVILKQAESGVLISKPCCEHGMRALSEQTALDGWCNFVTSLNDKTLFI